MSTLDPHRGSSAAALLEGAAREGVTPVDATTGDRTVELSTSELLRVQEAAASQVPDEVGPTVGGIPIRNKLAAARIAHALANARDAQALIDEAVELLATVRGLHAETYQLGAANGALRETLDLVARRAGAERDAGDASPTTPFDLKNDPTYEEISIWMSFGIPVTS